MSRSPTSPGRQLGAAAALGAACVVPVVDGLAGGHLVGTPWFTLAVVAAGFLVGAWLRPWPGLLAAVLGGGVLTLANQLGDRGAYSVVNDYFFFTVLLGGAVLAGALITGRRDQLRRWRELSGVRAAQHGHEVRAARLEEHSRLQTSVGSAMLERLEDLGDLTRGARLRTDAAALAAIEAAGRTVLEDLRRVVGVLHTAPPDPGLEADGPRPRTPVTFRWADALAGCAGIPLAVEAVAGSHSRGPVVANVALAVVLGLPLVIRRRRPLTALVAVFVTATVMSSFLTPLPTTVTVLAPLSLIAYTVGAHLRGLRRAAGVALLVVGLAATVLASPAAGRDPSGLLPTVAWVGLAVLFGVVSEQYASRAAEVADLLARVEQGRRDELTLVRAEQRAELAAELHDNLAHAMTVVCLHAEAAQLPGAKRSDVRASLDTIESVTGEALTELRAGLAGLVAMAEPGSLHQQIVRLADGLGLQPVVDVADVADDGIESVALLRVVREALVNAARYAPGASVEVRLRTTDALASAVVRNGPAGHVPTAPVGTGSGLRGLDTRVRAAGGRLRWGAEPDGGFEVVLELPRPVAEAAAVRMIRVLLADDQELIRSGLRLLLAAQPDIEVVAEAADGAAAVARAADHRPDLVLMDIKMPVIDGIEATRRITRRQPDVRVVILTTFDRDRLVYDALTAGATGFLLKDTPTGQLISGVRAAARGEELLAPSITRRLIAAFTRADRTALPPGYDRLTEREREVLLLVARGLSNDEIARELYVGLQTVKTHVARMLAKLDARDRVQAVVLAYEYGLVRPDPLP